MQIVRGYRYPISTLGGQVQAATPWPLAWCDLWEVRVPFPWLFQSI